MNNEFANKTRALVATCGNTKRPCAYGRFLRTWLTDDVPDSALPCELTTSSLPLTPTTLDLSTSSFHPMSTPILIGVGAIAAAVAGRSLMRRGLLGGKNAAEQWVKGGFKAKMDRKEAIAILGLKYVLLFGLV